MMEKKKKREKASINCVSGVETEGGSVQQNFVNSNTYKVLRPAAPADVLKRQREVEQQIVGSPAKKLLLSGSAPPVLPFSPSQLYPPVGHWQYPPAQQPPHFVPPAQPQPTLTQGQPLQSQVQQPQQQPQQKTQGTPQGAPQQGQALQPSTSIGQYYPFPCTSTDPSWQGTLYPGAPGLPSSLSYGYPGPYAYPAAAGQTGCTGTWPDQSRWAGNPTQKPQVFPVGYGPPYQGYGPAYGYVPPPGVTGVPPLAFQRGYIKAPPGLSQKHQRLWETQSCENIQLWITLARTDAELAALRNKILHMEGELHALRVYQGVSSDALNVPPGLQQPKRGRHKKHAGLVTNDLGAVKRGRKPVSDKTVTEDATKSDEKSKEKEWILDSRAAGVKKEETKGVSFVDGNKELFNATPVRNVLKTDICASDTSHTLDGDCKPLVYVDPYRSSYDAEMGLENGVNGEAHAAGKNDTVMHIDPSPPGFEVKITEHSDELAGNNCHSNIAPDIDGEDWTAAGVGRNCSFEGRLLYDSGAAGKSDRKVIQEWGEYAGEDVSDEHEVDELIPSGQEDEEDIDDDDDSCLHSIGGGKGPDLVVGLGSGKGIPRLRRG